MPLSQDKTRQKVATVLFVLRSFTVRYMCLHVRLTLIILTRNKIIFFKPSSATTKVKIIIIYYFNMFFKLFFSESLNFSLQKKNKTLDKRVMRVYDFEVKTL